MPLTIRIAEAIAWLYVALCVALLAHCVHLAYVGKCGGVGDAVIVAVFLAVPYMKESMDTNGKMRMRRKNLALEEEEEGRVSGRCVSNASN